VLRSHCSLTASLPNRDSSSGECPRCVNGARFADVCPGLSRNRTRVGTGCKQLAVDRFSEFIQFVRSHFSLLVRERVYHEDARRQAEKIAMDGFACANGAPPSAMLDGAANIRRSAAAGIWNSFDVPPKFSAAGVFWIGPNCGAILLQRRGQVAIQR
jgi:hypothetical protein